MPLGEEVTLYINDNWDFAIRVNQKAGDIKDLREFILNPEIEEDESIGSWSIKGNIYFTEELLDLQITHSMIVEEFDEKVLKLTMNTRKKENDDINKEVLRE